MSCSLQPEFATAYTLAYTSVTNQCYSMAFIVWLQVCLQVCLPPCAHLCLYDMSEHNILVQCYCIDVYCTYTVFNPFSCWLATPVIKFVPTCRFSVYVHIQFEQGTGTAVALDVRTRTYQKTTQKYLAKVFVSARNARNQTIGQNAIAMVWITCCHSNTLPADIRRRNTCHRDIVAFEPVR